MGTRRRLLTLSDSSRAWRACDSGGLPVRRAAQDGLFRASAPSDPLSSRCYIHFHFLRQTAFSPGFRARLRACLACSSSSSALLAHSHVDSPSRAQGRASVQRCLGSRGRHSSSPRLPVPRGFSLHQPRPRPSRAHSTQQRPAGHRPEAAAGIRTWRRVVDVPIPLGVPSVPAHAVPCPAGGD